MEEKTGLPAVLADVTERVRYYARKTCTDWIGLGEALTEAKKLVPHGEFEAYIQENAGMGIRTAQNAMNAYKRFGSNKEMIEGLNVGQVIALLPASDEEIAKISEDGDLSAMSTRKLKEAVRKAREEAEAEGVEKTREALEAAKEDKVRELAKQRAAFDDEMEALKAQIEEKKAEAETMRIRAEQAEEAQKMAIESGKEIVAQNSQAINEAEKLRRDIRDRDDTIQEMQEQYDRMREDLAKAQSTISRGDAGRSDADILSSGAVMEAVDTFMSKVGRVPHMHGAFAVMDNHEREEYIVCIRTVLDWAQNSLRAADTVNGNGGTVE